MERGCEAGADVLAAWLVEAFGWERWSQKLLQQDRLLPEQPGLRMPLTCTRRDPALGRSFVDTDQDFQGLPRAAITDLGLPGLSLSWKLLMGSFCRTHPLEELLFNDKLNLRKIYDISCCFFTACFFNMGRMCYWLALLHQWFLSPWAGPLCSWKAGARWDAPCPW